MKIKILVVADSHGNRVELKKIIENEIPFDILVHCGDGVGDLDGVSVPAGVPIFAVQGNIDSGIMPKIEEIAQGDAGGIRFIVTHGHRFNVKNRYDLLLDEAKVRDADIVFFGHTHMKELRNFPPVIFNPGPAHSGNYGLVIIDGGISCSHHRVD